MAIKKPLVIGGNGFPQQLQSTDTISTAVVTNGVVPTPVGTGAANGTQLDTVHNTLMSYPVAVGTTSTILGGQAGYAILEICATNSATDGNWVEVCRVTSAQAVALAIAVTLTQTTSGILSAVLPAGWYRRCRNVNTTGTPTFTYTAGQETKL